MAGHDEVCCGAVGRWFREYLQAAISLTGDAVVPRRVLAWTRVCLLFASTNLSPSSVNETQRRVTACSTLQAVSLASRIHNVWAALVGNTKQVLCVALRQHCQIT